jgi:hypothetical protein
MPRRHFNQKFTISSPLVYANSFTPNIGFLSFFSSCIEDALKLSPDLDFSAACILLIFELRVLSTTKLPEDNEHKHFLKYKQKSNVNHPDLATNLWVHARKEVVPCHSRTIFDSPLIILGYWSILESSCINSSTCICPHRLTRL